MTFARNPAVAGSFYPADAEVLGCMVDCLLGEPAEAPGPSGTVAPAWAFVVPHAGYIYSGSTAAQVYSRIRTAAAGGWSCARVVILGPTHRVAVDGVARSGASAFITPLGEARIDVEAESALDDLPHVVVDPRVHELEHALEVQVPFLQRVLPDVPIVPLAVGRVGSEQVGEVIDTLVGDDASEARQGETLVLVSSDLSHYLSYDQARQVDAATLEAVCSLSGPISHYQACGAMPLNGLLAAGRRRDLDVEVIAACNSGDTAGDKRRVVGYAAVALKEAGQRPEEAGS